MKAFEGVKRDGAGRQTYGISVACVIDAANSIESEFRFIKEALVTWADSRGADAKDVSITFTADEIAHDRIVKFVGYWCANDVRLAAVFGRCPLRLTMINMQNKVCKTLQTSVSAAK